MNAPKIVFVGGGSVSWGPNLLSDILHKPALAEAALVLVDHDLEAAELTERFVHKIAAERKLGATVSTAADLEQVAQGADFIMIAISTGGLEAMRHDLAIPEAYGIYQTVGDTVGPGGWARSLRNAPIFQRFAEISAKHCPDAAVLNYTNPMTVLTKVLTLGCLNRVVGLCHGLFESISLLKTLLKLKSEDDLRLKIAGINHFFWILAMSVHGKEGYAQLHSRLNGQPLAEVVSEVYTDGMGFDSNKYVCGELFQKHGLLPYVGDRHICEFLPDYLAPDTQNICKYKLERTTIAQRYELRQQARQNLVAMLDGKQALPEPTRETAADIIEAIWDNRQFIDVINAPNIGQVSNLPDGLVVETLGRVSSLGFEPLAAGALPEDVRRLIEPHAECLGLTVQAAIQSDRSVALEALRSDPLCSHLCDQRLKQMGEALLQAHHQFLAPALG